MEHSEFHRIFPFSSLLPTLLELVAFWLAAAGSEAHGVASVPRAVSILRRERGTLVHNVPGSFTLLASAWFLIGPDPLIRLVDLD